MYYEGSSMLSVKLYWYALCTGMYVQYICAAEHDLLSTLQLQAEEHDVIGRIKNLIDRPFDGGDAEAAKRLYHDTARRYDAYVQGRGEFPGELIWFSFDDPRINCWHFQQACCDDAHDDRVRREKLVIKRCLQADLIVDPTWSEQDANFAHILHAWVWKSDLLDTDIQHVQGQVEYFHGLCASKTDSDVLTWCQACKMLLANVMQSHIDRRRYMLAHAIGFTL